ncbi:MAG: alginate export family protein [Planctomycetota bacterium]
MSTGFTRRWRLLQYLLAPSLAAVTTIGSVQAEDQFSTAGLETVVVQTSAFEDTDAEEPAPEPVAETPAPAPEPMAQPVVEYQELGPVTSCNCAPTTCCTKKDKEAAAAAAKKAYAGVYYGNNFSYLKDPCYDGPVFCSDKLKNIDMPLGTLSLGGETRYRYHSERNHRGVGITGRDDQFWLSRHRLYADWKLCDAVRVYGEVLDANSQGETFGPRPIEENDMDIQNLFVDVKLFDGDCGTLTTRIGRQELLLGAQRTVSPLDWANTRRTFEGVRGMYKSGDFTLDAFWTQFVPVDPKEADEANEDIQFYGLYAVEKNFVFDQIEAYYLGFDNTTAADFSVHTIGTRVSGASDSGILYDFEGAFQFGDDRTIDDHSAGFFTAGLGRKIETDCFSPTIWLYYDYASGEEDFSDVSRSDGGYDHLFPLAHKYNGFMDLFGRRNLHDLNVFSATPLSKKVTMIVWYHYFALAEDTTPYSVVMTPYNTNSAAGDRSLGHEIDLAFNINLNPRNNIFLGYSHFSAGDYYDTTAGLPTGVDDDADADFFYAQFTTRY